MIQMRKLNTVNVSKLKKKNSEGESIHIQNKKGQHYLIKTSSGTFKV